MTALIFIPGLMCNHKIFGRIHQYLPQFHAADTTKDSSIKAMAERILAENTGDLNILGYSMGGYVALECALLAPQRVQKLMLSFTHAGADSLEIRQFRLNQLKLSAKINQVKVHPQYFKKLVHEDFAQDWEILAIINEMNQDLGPEIYYQQLNAILLRENKLDFLAQIHQPTLVLQASHDQLVSNEKIIAMVAKLPNVRHHIIENCGHTAFLERPNIIAPIINNFLES